MTTSVGAQLIGALAFVGEEADAHRAQLLVDVRVVDDLAGQEDAGGRESRSRVW